MKTGLYVKPARHVAICSALLGFALILSYIESFIPITAALPAFKIGLANIAVMAASRISLKDAAAVSILRVIIISIFFSNTVSFIFSLFGALFSLGGLFIINISKLINVSWIGVSVFCAALHNTGQILAAIVITGNYAPVAYIPVLLVSSILFGTFNGIVMNCISSRIK